MPTISKIRFTNVIYENGSKRYNDETFMFDGHNGAIVLENGGGKTVFIQTAIQAVIPHTDLAGRKVKDTLSLDHGPAHIAIEWILADKPRRRYAVTCVSLFQSGTGIDSYRYVYEYGEHDSHGLDHLPFVRKTINKDRAADRGEMQDYYSSMEQRYPLNAKNFSTIKEYKAYLEQQFQIITGEWEAIVKINETEGGIEGFFDECKTTTQLFDSLLIPTIERSIEGYEQGSFAKMFEDHREGFEKYKQLKEQIEENQTILHELDGYVQLFERLDRYEKDYAAVRSEAKAYWKLTLNQQKELQTEQHQLSQLQVEWNENNIRLLRKQKSLALWQEQQEKEVIETKLMDIEEDCERIEDALRQASQNYYSLQYSEGRSKLQNIQSKISQLRNQISRLAYSEDESMLQQLWEKNGMQLRYLFSVEEERLTAKVLDKQSSLDNILTQIKHMKSEISQIEKEIIEKGNQLSAKEEAKRIKIAQQKQIALAILSNPQIEKVEHNIPIWTKEELQLEQSKIDLLQEIKRLETEYEFKEQRHGNITSEWGEVKGELASLVEQVKQQQEKQVEMKSELAGLRHSWENLSSLYDKKASISEHMNEALERLHGQKSQMLMKERLAYRYVDDHGEQDIYFADAFISKLCEQWSNQFSLLQLGTHYKSDVATAIAPGVEQSDQLWAVTLITTEQEKEVLRNKIIQLKEGYSYPIRILSTQEATNILKNETTEAYNAVQWVVPTHWLNNEQVERFEQWKSELFLQAERTTIEREKIEADIAKWQSAQKNWNQFLVRYPLEVQQKLEQDKLLKQAKVTELERELEQLEYQLVLNREALEGRRKKVQEMEARINQLGFWLQDARKYMVLSGEVENLELEISSIDQHQGILQRQKLRKEAELSHSEISLEKIRQEFNDSEKALAVLKQDERYIETLSYEAEHTEGVLAGLKEERKALELQRHRIFQERTQLEEKLTREQDSEKDQQEILERLQTEHAEFITVIELPLQIEDRKSQWWGEILMLKEQLERVKGEHKRAEKQFQQKQGEITILLRQFAKDYPEQKPDVFHESQRVVQERLAAEERELKQKQQELKKQQLYITEQLQQIDSVIGLWNRHLLVHALEDVRLAAAELSEERQSEFRYKQKQIVESYIEHLNSSLEKLTAEKKLVQKGKHRLKEFFGTSVRDVKLRQMTLQGIETKENYAEISQFQQSMTKGIQMAIHVGEQTLQRHDQELQQYIQHIHAHLKLIVQELKEIPKKTRVKTDDGWKEIYSFSIPQWEEQDGKERIRKHIDWIMNKLERDFPKQEQDNWQEQQIRISKNLEKWLDAKQLIQIVMMGEGMKVTCRKVSNDQQVSRVSYSWEQSNRWSGGEKWSKNMTLFLGLLNYVAERKQFIQAKMKRHRTIILDNPFGKASSDHVLSPVFFIAEQLGFQMIALTAHVEGKFLQDYFPIVYSCRLRHTVDPSKQVIEAKQQVQTAYFQDNETDTLERIGSRVDQLELF